MRCDRYFFEHTISITRLAITGSGAYMLCLLLIQSGEGRERRLRSMLTSVAVSK